MSTRSNRCTQFLVDFRPATNPTTCVQSMKAENKFATKYPNLSPHHFLAHTRELTRSRATLLFRLITGHIQLRQHLHRLQLVDSPQCELCGLEPETVTHYLFRCSGFADQRHTHLSSRGPDFLHISFILHATAALDPLFDFIKATGRFADLVR